MPTAALKFCLARPCPNRVKGGYCIDHQLTHGSRHARGYDSAWVGLRNALMARPDYQLCVDCAAKGETVVATEAGHIIPFTHLSDPKRLDPANIKPLCKPCNVRERNTRHGGGGIGSLQIDAARDLRSIARIFAEKGGNGR